MVAKFYKFASVPRRDRLSIESVVMGVDGKTGPKTSPIKEEDELDLRFQIQIHADILTTQSDGSSRTSENVATEFRVRNDGRLFNRNVEVSQNMRSIFQIQQERSVSSDCSTFRLCE